MVITIKLLQINKRFKCLIIEKKTKYFFFKKILILLSTSATI